MDKKLDGVTPDEQNAIINPESAQKVPANGDTDESAKGRQNFIEQQAKVYRDSDEDGQKSILEGFPKTADAIKTRAKELDQSNDLISAVNALKAQVEDLSKYKMDAVRESETTKAKRSYEYNLERAGLTAEQFKDKYSDVFDAKVEELQSKGISESDAISLVLPVVLQDDIVKNSEILKSRSFGGVKPGGTSESNGSERVTKEQKFF